MTVTIPARLAENCRGRADREQWLDRLPAVARALGASPVPPLAVKRRPWLVIDPKPFVGDRAYDATQHLLNCPDRLRSDPHGTIARVADLLEVDRERTRLWLFGRAAAGPRRNWDRAALSLAKSIAP